MATMDRVMFALSTALCAVAVTACVFIVGAALANAPLVAWAGPVGWAYGANMALLGPSGARPGHRAVRPLSYGVMGALGLFLIALAAQLPPR